MDSNKARTVAFLILTSLATAPVRGQEPVNPNPTSDSSSASTKVAAASERVILKVGDIAVTQGEFESRIRDIEPQEADASEGAMDKDRRRLGDDYASVLVLSQQAVANHLDNSPEVRRRLAVARMQVLSDAEFSSLMQQAQPTFEEVSQYYAAHASDYEVVQIRRLFIWKQRENSNSAPVLTSQAARARAEQVRNAYASGTDANKLSGDLTKSQQGMLDSNPLTFSRGELSPQMEKVAFSLKEGEWSEVEDTPAHLLLIQLVKRDHQQLGQVSSHIEKQLQDQKLQVLLDDLKKKSGIWMDEQYFGTAVATVPGAQRRTSNPPTELQKSAKKGESNHEEQQK